MAAGHSSDPHAYRLWKPDAQQRALDLLRQTTQQSWKPFYCTNRECNGQPHIWPVDNRECASAFGHIWVDVIEAGGVCKICSVTGTLLDSWAFPHARKDQRPPNWADKWTTLLLRGGRGSGKTRTGSEIINRVPDITSRIILVGATGPDLRETMVEGESGILATAPPGKKPTWEPSRKRLVWPNGCIGQGFSAEEPDRLRGPQSGAIWADEPSHWAAVDEAWDNMLFGLRLKSKKGLQPKVIATSTPKPNKWTKETVADPTTIDRVVSTYANVHNLADDFQKRILSRFEGTRTGRQELHGELLDDVVGALWNYDIIHHEKQAPLMERILVGVDPAGTANKRSDETGIIGMGVAGESLYVLADRSGKYSPSGWARTTWDLVIDISADGVVIEKNYGGDMVVRVLESEWRANYQAKCGPMPRIIEVTSRRGKAIRAEPIVAMYEKKMVFHAGERGQFEKLEDEMTTWVPNPEKGPPSPSPNRVDALVHVATELAKTVMPAQVATPSDLLDNRARGPEGPRTPWRRFGI